MPGESLLRPVREIENTWIPLSDGTRLAARIWMPEDAEADPVPALLEFTPYRKDDATAAQDAGRHPYFAARGYASARVDLRGSGDSDGILGDEYLEQEQLDAVEVIAWLAAQPWSTGRVGMFGYSWGGFNALQVAARRPRELGAVIAIACSSDRYGCDCHYMGGCLLGSDMMKWASTMLAFNARPPDPRFVGDRWRSMWMDRLEQTPAFGERWLSHQLRDSYWRQGSVCEDYSAIEVPVFAVGGWADAYTDGAFQLAGGLDTTHKVLVGPWGHDYPQRATPGPRIGFLQEAVKWWDEWLKDVDCGACDEPMLRVWMQDPFTPASLVAVRRGRWVGEALWPAPDVHPLTLTLGADGSLAEGLAHAGLEGAAASVGTNLTCGEAAGVWCANGMPDEMPIDQNDDDRLALTFETAMLTESLELLGTPAAHLSLSVDKPNALVAVRLDDVHPSGDSSLISWGLLNLTHRDGHDTAVPLSPGARYDVRVDLRPLGQHVPAGHRLRLAVSPAYWPHAWPSPELVTLTVHTDGGSRVVLPVRERHQKDDPLPEFGTPRESTPLEMEIPESSGRIRKRRCDVATGTTVIEDREVYVSNLPVTGTEYRHLALDRWSIVEGDPLSAEAHHEREERLSRAGWNVRIRTETTLTSDAASFHLRARLEAFEEADLVFSRDWSTDIPREGV